jgi:hypothetical protein
MTQNTKSLIRHILTALGTIVALIGLNGVLPIIDFLQESLDQVWDSVVVVIGFITTLYGYLKDNDRHLEREKTLK